MDLVYIPEVLTFGSFRSPQYRDYEQPWNRDYFDDGKAASYQQQRPQQQRQRRQPSKDACQLCKESKRRRLAAYIRGKARDNSCAEICEEPEEPEHDERDERDERDEQLAGQQPRSRDKPDARAKK